MILTWVLTAGAVLCLIYFVVIVAYSGLGTASVMFWFWMAAGLGFTAWSNWAYQREPERLPLRLPVTLVTLCAAGVVVMLVLQILIFSRVPVVAEPDLDYVIVLGAQARDNRPGKTLTLRLDLAAEYARQNPDTVLVLSGGQGRDEKSPEAVVMRDYLLAQGVPPERMLLESMSRNTAQNIGCSRDLISVHWHGNRPAQIGILTSNFHLYRALKIAQRQGIAGVQGIAAKSDRVLFLHFAFRDGLALLKNRLTGEL